MAWQPEKAAGFALAALLAGDRELKRVAGALTPEQHTALAQLLAFEHDKEASVLALLRILKPELNERASALPARIRVLLARSAKAGLRRKLLRDTEPTRPHFNADQALLHALSRIARKACETPRS